MQLARVVGTVVSTRKEPNLEGLKLLVVKPLDEEGRDSANALVAADKALLTALSSLKNPRPANPFQSRARSMFINGSNSLTSYPSSWRKQNPSLVSRLGCKSAVGLLSFISQHLRLCQKRSARRRVHRQGRRLSLNLF